MTKPQGGACNVVNEGCLAWIGSAMYVRSTCFACGHFVCANCSSRRTWFRHGRRRICYDCAQENDRRSKTK